MFFDICCVSAIPKENVQSHRSLMTRILFPEGIADWNSPILVNVILHFLGLCRAFESRPHNDISLADKKSRVRSLQFIAQANRKVDWPFVSHLLASGDFIAPTTHLPPFTYRSLFSGTIKTHPGFSSERKFHREPTTALNRPINAEFYRWNPSRYFITP